MGAIIKSPQVTQIKLKTQMRKLISRLALLTATALTMMSCDGASTPGGDNPANGESGKLKFSLSPQTDIYIKPTTKAQGVDLSDFEIKIKDAAGTEVKSYGSYSDVPSEIEFKEGLYIIEASTGSMLNAAFDAPHFAGLSNTNVKVGETSEVTVTCAITNVKITVEYTPNITNTLSNIKTRITTRYDANDKAKVGTLTFKDDETRAGWFAPPFNNNLDVYVEGINKETGKKTVLSQTLTNINAREWVTLSLDIKTSGAVDVDITIDSEILIKDDIDITIPEDGDIIDNNGDDGSWDDEPTEPTDPDVPGSLTPEVTGAALGTTDNNSPFDIDSPVVFLADSYTVLDVLLKSKDEGGIASLFLTIDSPTLNPLLGSLLEIEGEIDLANPDQTKVWAELFVQVGLINPDIPIKGSTNYTFSVGGLMELLDGVGGKGEVHLFKLRVQDANGVTAKTLAIDLQ